MQFRKKYSSILLTLITLMSMVGVGATPAATLNHRYDFSTDVSDSIGSADGSLQSGATISGGAVHLNGVGAYVELPVGLVAGYEDITIETWVTDNGSGTWARIFDFGNNTTTYWFLTPQGGSGALRGAITLSSGGGEQLLEWSGTRLPIGAPTHVVWTYDSASTTGRLYVDGTMVAENTGMTLAPSDMGSTTNNWLGRSQWNDPYFNGSIDEFRIYDGALSEMEVGANYINGPDGLGPVTITKDPENQTVEEAHPATFDIAYYGTPPINVQWFRDSSPISGATNDSYTIAEPTLSDDGALFHAEVANLHDGMLYTDTSDAAILTVTADTTEPTLDKASSIFPTGVRVEFSERLSDETALNLGNYSITHSGGSLPISSVAFGEDKSVIILNTATQVLQTSYTLHVSNVHDRSSAANAIAADSQATFIAANYVIDDIGSPSIGGSVEWVSDGIDFTAAGNGIGMTTDQFSFYHKIYSGNFDIQVRTAGMTFPNQWARAGLMVRDGLDANARFAAIFATPGPAGCQFMARSTVGGSVLTEGCFPNRFPNTWLRLRRTGDLLEGFAGIDGTTWERLGSVTVSMASTINVGYALTSSDDSSALTAGFRDAASGGGSIVSSIALPFEPLGPSSRRGAMVISEIMVDSPAIWAGTNSMEFIELYNSGLITEDLTGHRFSGEIDYTFPDGTTIAPGEFLVIAKDPDAAASFYGVPCLGPYDGKLSNSGGTLRFRNELDGILLEVEYDNRAPWPVAAFGTGHSMVLSHPSYGETDPRAWSASDVIGGSPGAFEGYGVEAARGVVINEYLAHTDLPQVDYVELFNTGMDAVDLSGFWLSDSAGTNKYRIADGTVVSGGGYLSFDETELGFAFSADGESIYLVNSNQTRVIDAVAFRGQANGVAEGRYPDGAPGFQMLSAVTEGTANAAPWQPPVVINEIMYHPISGSNNDEYIELYNRSGGPVDLSNWRLQGGVSYQFPEGIVIPTGGYVVVAENLTNLLARYVQLNTSNTFGNYIGALNNSSERIALSVPEDLVVTNEFGTVETNIYYIPIDEVTYLDGGRWGEWSDGGGSSLELIDPDADNRQPANWADSDESAKASWTTIDLTDILENGQGAPDGTANRFEFYLQGAGEMLLDDLEFLNNGGANMLSNGDFSTGSSGWSFGGVVRNSYVESGVGQDGSDALHLVSTARGDMGCNQADHALDGVAAFGGSNTGTIRAKVRWLKGSPYILLRLRGHWMEVSQPVSIPSNCGTPGQANSRLVVNAGPAIYDVVHSPVLPTAGEAVVVTARATDPDGIASMTLHYRIDPNVTYSTVTMRDDGTSGDAIAGDGLYSATVFGQSDGTLIAFYVTAFDGAASGQFPATVPEHECLIRWGESQISGSIGTYRLWMTAANVSFWSSRERNANDPIDATFVYGNHRVVYNVGSLYSGSPFHTGAYNGPIGSFACDYEVNFNPDERFLGSEPFVLAGEGNNADFWFDYTTQIDLTSTWIGRKLGQQYNYRRHVNVVLNGSRRGVVYMDSQQPNSEMLDEYYPNDSNGQLRKIEDWFEFRLDNQSFNFITATLQRFNGSDGAIDAKRYRWNWRPRVTQNHDQWYPFTNLVAVVNDTSAVDYENCVRTWMDVRNFLRPVAVNRIVSNWDSYGYERGKNMYAYKPEGKGWRLLLWDIELAIVDSGNGPYDQINDFHDPALSSLIKDTPAFYREYLMAFQEAVDRVLVPDVMNPILDERYANLLANGITVVSPSGIENWLATRRSYLQSILPSAIFDVDGPHTISVATNNIVLTGSAPLQVADILVNGIAYPIDWNSVTEWNMLVPLFTGTNNLSIVGTDRFGEAVPGAAIELTVTSTVSVEDPLDDVVINEWMADNESTVADPADGDYEDWFELYNRSGEAVDLGGCYLTDELNEPFEYRIPDNGHYVIPAFGYLLVWADDEATQNSINQSDLHVSFSLSKDSESIGLYAPDGHVIDVVSFGAQVEDRSEGRCPSGASTVLEMLESTPGSVNSLPARRPVITDFHVGSPGVSFNFGSVSGLYYQVYYSSDLWESYWIPLGPPIEGTGHELSFTNAVAVWPHCFFRIGLSYSDASQALKNASVNGSDITFDWDSMADMQYRILFKNDLQDAVWHPLAGPVAGTGGTMSHTNTTGEATQRFYLLGVDL